MICAMRKKFLTITFFCVGCGILITGCSSGYKIKPASVIQTGYVTQNPMSSAEYSLFLNKETTVFTNALVTRMNSIKNITKEVSKRRRAGSRKKHRIARTLPEDKRQRVKV